MKNLFNFIFSNKIFWPVAGIMFGTSILSLIPAKGVADHAIGLIVTFLYFIAFIAYGMFKSSK